MGSGVAPSPDEGESYLRALAKVSCAGSVEEARAIAGNALGAWRAGPPRGRFLLRHGIGLLLALFLGWMAVIGLIDAVKFTVQFVASIRDG